VPCADSLRSLEQSDGHSQVKRSNRTVHNTVTPQSRLEMGSTLSGERGFELRGVVLFCMHLTLIGRYYLLRRQATRNGDTFVHIQCGILWSCTFVFI
jgi:hypothetical protein